jgi:hypothetical protein
MVSTSLKQAVKTSDLKAFQIAHAAGLHPSTLSQIVCGIVKVQDGDKRVLKIGAVVGLKPEQCFESGIGKN